MDIIIYLLIGLAFTSWITHHQYEDFVDEFKYGNLFDSVRSGFWLLVPLSMAIVCGYGLFNIFIEFSISSNFDRNIDDLFKNGFTNINNFFQKEKINIISNEIQRVFLNDKNNKEENKFQKQEKIIKKIYAKRGALNKLNTFSGPILGKSKVIDKFIIELFNNSEFKTLSEKLVGKNFKIYTLHLRDLNNFSKYLGLHQDSYYQVSFQIPLNDISNNDSATCFVSGSHLSKFPLLDQLFSITEKVSNKFFSFSLPFSIMKIIFYYNQSLL